MAARSVDDAYPVSEALAVPAPGRELYHKLGFETKERSNSRTSASVASLQPRSWQAPFVLVQVAMCLGVIAATAPTIGAVAAVVGSIVSYLLYDLLSGMAHYVLDQTTFNTLPFFGDLARTFQHHHADTTFIWRSSAWTSLSEVGLFLHLSDSVPLLVLSLLSRSPPPIFWYLSACKTLVAFLGELGHRAAHKPPSVRSRLERALQRAGLYIDPKYHLGAHHTNLEIGFCELGKMDACFDAMRAVCANHWLWAALTLVMSYADTWAAGALILSVV